jgi:hypothetical protein
LIAGLEMENIIIDYALVCWNKRREIEKRGVTGLLMVAGRENHGFGLVRWM